MPDRHTNRHLMKVHWF